MQNYTIAAKRVVDLYLVIVAHRLWEKNIAQAVEVEKRQPRQSARPALP
jgi:hypothetical protein